MITRDDGLAKTLETITILPHRSNKACFPPLYFSAQVSSNAIILQSVYNGENLITLV